jgi:monofunctional chorismate mutase, gram positive-type, clade 2
MSKLKQARKRINEIDQELTTLFEERMKLVEDVIAYKKEESLPIFDNSREQEVLKQTKTYIKENALIPFQQQFMQNLMDISKDYQRVLLAKDNVAYQGVAGAFSHIAARKLYPHFQLLPLPSFESLFQAVSNNEVQYALVPFENSYTGEIGEVLDLLYHYDVFINRFYDLKVEQNLIGLPGAKIEGIRQVYSHSQALQQSLPFLKTLAVELIPFENTALAARYIHETGDVSKAAIAAKETADIYQLETLQENVHAAEDNTTRFIVIAKEINTNGDHISIQFTTKHEAGELSKVIQIISSFDFNLESIKSRASKKEAWQYHFYLEIQADPNSSQTKAMLEEIKKVVINLKITGIFNR